MPELADGETARVQGSAAKPYELKNVGGVYSCSCPAWRNQSAGIERRTCKHLRAYRGAEAVGLRAEPAAAPARRFVEPKSGRYWEVAVRGDDVVLRSGRKDGPAQEKTKTFADAAAAQKHAERLLAEKTAEGWREE